MTYGCDKHQIVVCLEIPEANLLVPQQSAQPDDGEPHAQQRERLGRERAAHSRCKLGEDWQQWSGVNVPSKPATRKAMVPGERMKAYFISVATQFLTIVFRSTIWKTACGIIFS